MEERCELLQCAGWKQPDVSLLSSHAADKQGSLIREAAQGPARQWHYKARNSRWHNQVYREIKQESRHNADGGSLFPQKPEQERKLAKQVS